MPDKVPLYDDFSHDYDVMVSWGERLEREQPFFQEIFRSVRARRVLDVGCATGGHAVLFADMGLEVVGADPSAEMLRLARERSGSRSGVRFVQAGFGELAESAGGDFDVVTCLGNTLPHAVTRPDLDRALSDISSVLRPGSVFAAQLLNYDRILRDRRRFLGVSSGFKDGVEELFFRFYDFAGADLSFNVVTLRREGGGWGFQVGSTPLRAITRAELGEALAAAGLRAVRWLGSYAGEPFDPESSGDLVVVATKD